MAQRIEAHPWAETPLGPREGWPRSLRTLVDLMLSSLQPMFMAWGPEQTWLYNDAFVPILGRKHPSALGRAALDVWGEARDSLAPLFARVFAGEPVRMDDLEIHLDRHGQLEPAHFAFSYSPARDEDGAVAGLFGVCVETTARVRTERFSRQLVNLTDRFRELADPDELSYAAAELLGEALGVARAGYGTIDPVRETVTVHRDWTAPGVHSVAGHMQFRSFGSYIEDLKRGELVVVRDVDVDERTRSGAEALKALRVHSLVNFPIIEQQGLVALFFLNHDAPREWTPAELDFVREVSERTRTAVERRRAEHDLMRLAASLERKVAERTAERDRVWRNSRDLLCIVGSDGVFRAVNPAWTQILGHAPADVIGQSFLDFVVPEDAERTREGLDTAASAHDLTDFENRYRHVDGSLRYISWHTAVEGDLVYAYGRDVTAQREQSKALRQAEDALRQSQKIEAMGQLTGGVAHDFNNLLAVAANNLYLHQRLSPGCRDSPQLLALKRALDTGARLTRQLLAFARRQAIKPEVLSLPREIAELEHVLRVTLGSGVRLELLLDDETPPVRVDRSELELAIINLAMNARDAMPDGGSLRVVVRATTPEELRGERGALLEISDSGHGIPPELQARVLEPFFSTKGPGRGTGLGLSQVYGFANQADGRFELSSEPGVSTTVRVFLPATDAGVPDARRDGQRGEERLRARVLVVEDNVELGSTTRELLQIAGCDVLHLTSGEQARAFLTARDHDAVDIVLSDVVMPGDTSGVALAQWLAHERPGLPVVLVTGHSTELVAAREQGFTVLQKPVAPERLLALIRKRVDGRTDVDLSTPR